MLRLIIFLILSLYFGQALAQNTDLKPCKNAEGKWGYCNSQGKVVIAQKYSAAQAFWENTYAIVKNQANFYNVLNTKGEEILPNYTVGAIGVQILNKQLIFTLYKAHSGREMYYRAHLPQHKEYAKEGFEVRNINKYITGKFDTDFADLNLIKVESKAGLKGYINKKGDIVVPIKYNIWYDFSEGLVFFEKEKEVFAAMDTTGKELFVVPEKMSYCPKGFSSGLALICPNHKAAYFVDKSGKKVTDVFDLELERDKGIGYFRGDIAPIYKNGKWRFFDKTGKILPEEYEEISGLDLTRRDFTWEALGLIWVSQKDKKTGTILKGYVNGKGKVVVPIEHTSVWLETDKATNTSFIEAEKLDKKGVKLVGHYDKEGKIIKPFEVKK